MRKNTSVTTKKLIYDYMMCITFHQVKVALAGGGTGGAILQCNPILDG